MAALLGLAAGSLLPQWLRNRHDLVHQLEPAHVAHGTHGHHATQPAHRA